MSDNRRAEHQYFDFLPGALIEVDLASRSIIYMNRIAFSLFDRKQTDIDSGLSLRDIFVNDTEYERSIKVAESFGLENYQNRTAYSRYEKQDLYDFMMMKKNGAGFLGECQGAFVLDEAKVPVGARIYIRDLSEQREIEAEHIENEAKYQTLLKYSSDLIFLIDDKGVILSVNRATTKYLGRKTSEIEGQNISEMFPAQTLKTFQGYLNKAFISGKSITYETPMPTTNEAIWVSTSINPVRDRSGNVTAVLGVSRDITAWKQAEEGLEQALIEARNANKVKDQFIANITHEIRTPLTSITGFTDRLKQSLGENLKPAEEDYFKFIYNSSNRLLRTVDSIINLSQLEAGTLQLDLKLHHLGQLIHLLCEKLTPEATEKGLKLDCRLLTDDDETWFDQHSIYHSIHNILQNAIKYTDEGSITVQLERMNGKLQLTFTDTGIGISDEYRQRMFQVFSQESEGMEKDYQGIGLGLALTKRYLDMNHVKIGVDSEKGSGSTFTLIFPNHSGK
ncbi:MAG: PAS domain-containing sensor histidine kinase [Candidatus Marinimicrobia bacterium]|jgi:PAS domain S-box-containing protein|nr:PAS domain-containing sensor histidine kinase [Candidatus Neomarinimicrobiota bacterium]MBT3630525.1 PAS domain-containing sensor histidine kinase [Candidatus Neomarinimicrobiota bacterium]MBT3826024.1 PAS domain-containing sensor histidine kinase [Candidatus Neomarinimicrobiota bacterium]MBT4129854.1 PAS domain-containing sensor histidine kinase [Candidatus Neomarinimicrobiota bacterium]MBT4294938.1 PAS domain-containing sensor histidine kinase [Candidatus Neomarinimicrobiota bacterium]